MNVKEFREKWVAALRSGEYKQGHTFLKSQDRYCCLGVACQVLGIIPDEHGNFKDGSITGAAAITDDGHQIELNGVHYPTPRQLDLMGLTPEMAFGLSMMNDASGNDFSTVADYIEKRLPLPMKFTCFTCGGDKFSGTLPGEVYCAKCGPRDLLKHPASVKLWSKALMREQMRESVALKMIREGAARHEQALRELPWFERNLIKLDSWWWRTRHGFKERVGGAWRVLTGKARAED